MKKPPCIRGIVKHCPQKSWDGSEGCPAWIEMTIATKGDPLKKEIRKQCIDLWQHDFSLAALGLLEGNQQATESFRNNMTTSDGRPKPDPALLKLVQLLEIRKQIDTEARLKALAQE
jgi:hypothetical protein